MKPNSIKIYWAPDACPRVTLTALEEIGVPYEKQLIKFMAGEHVSPEYLAKNPLGGVPALDVDGTVLFQNSAIIKYLAEVFPEAGLLPKTNSAIERWEHNAIFAWLSADVHPRLSKMRFPFLHTDVPEAFKSIGDMGAAQLKQKMGWMDKRLESQTWVLGDDWSILDAYLSWAWHRAAGPQLPAETFPAIDAMTKRHAERASAKRVAEIEAEGDKELEAAGFLMKADNQ